MRPRTALLRPLLLSLAAVLVAVAAGTWYFSSSRTRIVPVPANAANAAQHARLPRPAHVVIVIDENKSFENIIGNTEDAPYLNELAAHAAVFTRSYGVAHPSQPNYFALFAGRTDTDGDSCDVRGLPAGAENLGAQLLAARRTFVGYAEGLPAPGDHECTAGDYARKHAPWTHFSNVPSAATQPFTAFPVDRDRLPTVAFVIPDLQDDMHSASIAHGDAWLRRTLVPLVAWAARHDTLVVVTWDESSAVLTNHIPTLFVGPMVKPGRYAEVISHYDVLRTLEDMYGLPHAGNAAGAHAIAHVWKSP
jgi:phosphatidylinositol-3-phosphatase